MAEQSAQRFFQWYWGFSHSAQCTEERVNLNYSKQLFHPWGFILDYLSSGCDSLWGKDCETERRKGKVGKINENKMERNYIVW